MEDFVWMKSLYQLYNKYNWYEMGFGVYLWFAVCIYLIHDKSWPLLTWIFKLILIGYGWNFDIYNFFNSFDFAY